MDKQIETKIDGLTVIIRKECVIIADHDNEQGIWLLPKTLESIVAWYNSYKPVEEEEAPPTERDPKRCPTCSGYYNKPSVCTIPGPFREFHLYNRLM